MPSKYCESDTRVAGVYVSLNSRKKLLLIKQTDKEEKEEEMLET